MRDHQLDKPSRVILGLTGIGLAVFAVVAINQLIRPVEAAMTTTMTVSVVGLPTILSGVYAMRRTRGRHRLAWFSFFFPLLVTLVAHGADPDKTDTLWPGILCTPLIGIGLIVSSVLLRVGSWHRRAVERAVVDGLWVAVASFPLWWVLGIDQILSGGFDDYFIQPALVCTAVLAVIASADAVASIPRIDPVDRPRAAAMALAGVGIAAASIVGLRSLAITTDVLRLGPDLVWIAAFLAMMLSTAYPVPRAAQTALVALPTRSYLAVTVGPIAVAVPFAVGSGFQAIAGWWAVAVVAIFGLRTFTLLRENDALTNQLHHDSYHDQLTGFGNRRMLDNRLAQGGEATVVYLDLDGFKAVNDTHGHQTGDALLIAVGERLRTAVRDNDLVIRLGGDEFAVLLDADPNIAQRVAQRLVSSISTPFDINGTNIQIGTSVGIATGHLTEHGDILQHADHAMYRAKKAGGHRIEMAEPAAP